MKIALAPDLHCFYNTYSRLNADGKSYREVEWQNSVDVMLEKCIEKKVKIIVVPGDIFTNPRPTAEQVLKVATLFERFEKAKIRVVGVAGNHDIGGIGTKCMNDVVSSIGGKNHWCETDFGVSSIGDIGFAYLPFVKNASLDVYNPDYANLEASEQLMRISKELLSKLDEMDVKTKILVGHWSIQGAVSSSGRSLDDKEGMEVVLPLKELAEQGWDACMFGHIHKPQVLKEANPFIAYSGAIQRIDIGEAKDARGFYIYDVKKKTNEFIDLPAIEMKSFNTTIASEDDVKALFDEIESSDIEEKIVQVKYDINKSDIELISQKDVARALAARNPRYIVGVFPRILDKTRQRDSSITESMDNIAALKKWMETKKYPESEFEAVRDLLKTYVS